jgi:MoxR-like ATPase
VSMYTDLYKGDGKRTTKPAPVSYEDLEPYVPNPRLQDAVNLAIFLNRPLLLEGEAGSGKSRLARAIAYELGLPLYIWDVRSTSKARDGLYTYDAILRLHDVHVREFHEKVGGTSDVPADTSVDSVFQNGEVKIHYAEDKTLLIRDPSNAKHYRRLGALGKAYDNRGVRSVILIDEVDKADIDFPNDLLTVLEDGRFYISETGETIVADPENPPIVIITSNKEKGNLPKPFLRRCIYYYVQFPDNVDTLKQIVNIHHKRNHDNAEPDGDLVHKAVSLFLEVRKTGLQKPPSTSELLDWINALHFFRERYDVSQLGDTVTPKIPYIEVLYKLRTDVGRLLASS